MKTEKQLAIEELLEQIEFYNLNYIQERLIMEAIWSDEWDMIKQYDGCTAVPEFHINKYVFDCFVHDFHWQSGRGGKVADQIFYSLMIARGFPKFKAKKRYLGVRIAWHLWYKWKHKKKNNVKPLTLGMKNWLKNNKIF